jgi:DNA-binding MarR family transcriptional regulator
LTGVEDAFSRFVSRSSLPRLRERVSAAAGSGVDFAGHRVLARVDEWGPVRATDLADRVGLDLSTVSRRLADLEEAGLVRRTIDPDDRRAQLVEATPRGRKVLERLRRARRALIEEALEGWPTEDLVALGDLLSRFGAALGDAVDGASVS